MDDRAVYMDVEAQKRSKYDPKIKRRPNTSLEWVSSERTTISLAILFCFAMLILYMWQSNNAPVQNTTNPFLKWLHDSHSNHNLFPSHALFTPRLYHHIPVNPFSDQFHIVLLVRQRSLVEASALERTITSISEATNAHTAHITLVQVGQQDGDVQRLINKYKSTLFEHHVTLDESSDVFKEALKTGFAQLKQNLPRLSYTNVPSLGKDARDKEVMMAQTNGNQKLTIDDYVKFVIVLQDNEVVSKDFFVVFQQVAPIFAADESMFSVSAYNPLSRETLVKNKKSLHRMNHFSEHAWMISRNVYGMLQDSWSDGGSFAALAEKVMADKHLETMYPEISRAKVTAESLAITNMDFVDLFGNRDDLGTQPTFSIVGLTKANYEWEIIQNDWIIPGRTMTNLKALPDLLDSLKKNQAVLIYHDSPTQQDFYSKWQKLMKKVAKNSDYDDVSSDMIQQRVYNGLFQHNINGVKYVWIEQQSSFKDLLLKHQSNAQLLTSQDFDL